ncbi:DUF6814 family protein [Flavobacterium sp.]|jgi:hypothetical protein|uniref:DUF6814 family protein n=1 Tax=Flavobacterium sp. TaxID=239 RepID=UPI0022C7B7F5|nr:hypothetical protein [Flavobacterium sp.]MCZ8230247.1 hypothetical protein [Flavobacterium sp.]
MNALKKYLGVVWIAIGAISVYYLFINQALDMWKAGGEKLVPAIIYTFILCPLIAYGMFTFGKYCLSGEYDD